jgi:chromosome segregation ATPase
MSFSAVMIISLAAGVILVVGGGLMMYMGNLVRSAYELKVQINSEVDERLTKMAEELDKKSRWIKRDLLEEIDKIKVALQSDNARKFQELAEPVLKRLGEYEELLRHERAEWVKAVESDRQNINTLDQKIRALRRELKKAEGVALPAEDSAAAALDEAAAMLAATALPEAPAVAEAVEAPPAPPPAPQPG